MTTPTTTAVLPADLTAAVHATVAWLDTHNGRDHHQITCRILKIAEEFGEVAEAWFGSIGNNPRKGHTHTIDDVAAELADVIVTALVALHSLPTDPAETLAAKAGTITTRCATTRAAENGPPWRTCAGCAVLAPIPPDETLCDPCRS